MELPPHRIHLCHELITLGKDGSGREPSVPSPISFLHTVVKSFAEFIAEVENRGKDWFALPKSTSDSIVRMVVKRKGKPRSRAIPNDTGLAPHSAMKTTILSRL